MFAGLVGESKVDNALESFAACERSEHHSERNVPAHVFSATQPAMEVCDDHRLIEQTTILRVFRQAVLVSDESKRGNVSPRVMMRNSCGYAIGASQLSCGACLVRPQVCDRDS